MSSDLHALLTPPGKGERNIILKKEFMTKTQERLLSYQKCYEGKLFDEECRRYPWGQQMDFFGNEISQDRWKPQYMPSIARELVETVSAYLTGKDKFPSVTVEASSEIPFSDLPEPSETESTEENDESPAEEAQEDALSSFVRCLLEHSCFEEKTADALDAMLIKGKQPLLIRIYGGRTWLTVPDSTWCSWDYDEDDPAILTHYQEAFFFTRAGDVTKEGQLIEYLYLRQVDAERWYEAEIPLEKDLNGKLSLGEPVVLFDEDHGFDFCPVALFETDTGDGLYANEVLENIRGYIKGYNNVNCGIEENMRPQWVLLKDTNERNLAAGTPGGGEEEPLRRGRLWQLRGSSIQSFANQTAGYEMASATIKDGGRAELRQAAHVIDIPPGTELSGRALLMMFAPQYASIDRLRARVTKAIEDLIQKIVRAAMTRLAELKFKQPIPLPAVSTLEGLQVSLDWGQLMPITPDVVKEELSNVIEMISNELMSQESAQAYMLPFFHIKDIDGERRKIAAEKEAKQQTELAMAKAAFDMNNPPEEVP